jgi:flavin reductase (DIM6/NTAB) family NADH-FMN oxidoreductase RutF
MAESDDSTNWIGIDPSDFRTMFSEVCTPVGAVTAILNGQPHGTTVNAFVPISPDPPTILVSLDRSSALLQIVQQTGRFGLNVLADDQWLIAKTLATKDKNKFAGLQWRLEHGVPRLDGASGWLSCEVREAVSAADHVLVIGRVDSAEATGKSPLLYHRRSFRGLPNAVA